MKCKHCKKNIDKDEPIQVIPLGQVHVNCMDDFVNKIFIDNKMKKQKRQKEMKAYKKKVKTKSKLKQTQIIFNEYIRRRDATPIGPCISCGMAIKFGDKKCHAGHFYTRGARSDLRYNEDNVFAQCYSCNIYGDAKTMVQFKKNVIKRIGQKKFDKLSERIQQDYSEKALTKLQKKYRALINNFKNNG